MRNLYNSKAIFLFLWCLLPITNIFSCNLSSVSLLTITGTGPYTITIKLCVGGGLTGATRGADNDTRSVVFAFYESGSFTISSFSPANMTGSFTTCSMPGTNIGAQGSPFNSKGTIMYIDPGYYGIAPCVTKPYQCVTSTANCGNASQQCTNFSFVTNVIPDSMRVFGVEGAGNPVAGCTPNTDMFINFGGLLPVFWSTVSAKKISETEVSVNWTTLSEVNNYFFTIEKTNELLEASNHHGSQEDLSVWTQCGIVNGTNKNNVMNYSFTDKNPFPGVSYYRIKQTDFSGKFSYSRIVLVSEVNKKREIKIYPNPAKDILTIEAEDVKSISLLNMLGMKVYESKADNYEIHTIRTQGIPIGIYLLKLEMTDGTFSTSKIRIED